MPDDAPAPNPPSEAREQGDEPSQKTDWRLVAIIAIVLLLLVGTIVWTYNRYLGINQVFKAMQ